MEQWPVGDNTVATGTVLYRSKVTKGETPDKTVIGERERVGATANVELGNLGFDYNTGRMYAVDYTNGGMAIVDLDSGAVDLLGTFSGDIGGPTYATVSYTHLCIVNLCRMNYNFQQVPLRASARLHFWI